MGGNSMSKAKYFFVAVCAVFGFIAIKGYQKKQKFTHVQPQEVVVQEIAIPQKPLAKISQTVIEVPPQPLKPAQNTDFLDQVDRIGQLFALDSSKLPIVETVSYTSRVPWLKGRPAWVADYATYFETSRHFIARSLNKKCDYFTQKVGPGDRFNVFKKDKNIRFHLLIDINQKKMRFYYVDLDTNESVLLKTYKVGLGRIDPARKSGSLTPLGKYELGERIAIYKPGTMGFFQDKKTEMIRVFGTRWIPFEKELENCTEAAKGLGIHGAPFIVDPQTGNLIEDKSKIGKNESDGCIRLVQDDVEELFAIIITKPTTVEIVKSFQDAKLPGIEK